MVNRALAKLEHRVMSRVRGIVRRAVLRSLSESGVQLLTVDTYAGRRTVEYVQHYGFASKPLAGAEAIVVGDATMFAVACDDASLRPDDLAPGESAQYGKNTGQRITCKADGSVEIEPMAGQVLKIGANATKALALAEDVDARLNEIKNTFNAHTHPGVTAGIGSTAVPAALIIGAQTIASTKAKAE